MMRLKRGDDVWCNKRRLTGQIKRIMNEEATIYFVTGDKVKKKIKDIFYVENQWRMND